MILPPDTKGVIINPERKYMVLQKTPIANVFASGGSESKECVVLWQDTHCVRVRKVAVEKGIPHKESLQEGLQS